MNRIAPLKHRANLPSDWTMEDSIALATLPKGWRWLKIGERVTYKDVICDPRAKPKEIMMEGSVSWCIDSSNNHPVRREIASEIKRK